MDEEIFYISNFVQVDLGTYVHSMIGGLMSHPAGLHNACPGSQSMYKMVSHQHSSDDVSGYTISSARVTNTTKGSTTSENGTSLCYSNFSLKFSQGIFNILLCNALGSCGNRDSIYQISNPHPRCTSILGF